MKKCEECSARAWFEIQRVQEFPMPGVLLPRAAGACRRHVASILVELEDQEGQTMEVKRVYFPGA